MKFQETTRNVVTNLPDDRKAFTIEANEKSFQILSRNIYKDPKKAIIRELSANALDAHRMNGQTRPFEVSLPSQLAPELIIKDYGPGMDKSTMMSLYSSYFSSDKRDTNELVGGLGLGSKTPLAYVDVFTVVSRQGERMQIYTVHKDDHGTPVISMISDQVNPDNDTGLTITIPIKREDFSSFHDKAQDVLARFPKDSFTGIAITPLKYLLHTSVFAIREYTGWKQAEATNIVMGPIAYKIEKSRDLLDNVPKHLQKILEIDSLDIFANIGDVEIAPSRESVMLETKASMQKLVGFLQRIYDTMPREIMEHIKTAPTIWEASRMLHKASDDWGLGHMLRNIEWRGQLVKQSYQIEADASLCLVDKSTFRNKTPKFEWKNNFQLIPGRFGSEPPAVVLLEYNQAYTAKVEWLVEEDHIDMPFFLMRDHDTKLPADYYKAITGVTDVKKLADYPDIPKSSPKARRSRKSTKVKLKTCRAGYSYGTWTEEDLDLSNLDSTNIFWVRLEGGGNWPVTPKDAEIFRLIHYWKEQSSMNLDQTHMVGIPRSLKHKEKLMTIPHISEWFRGFMIDILDEDNLVEYLNCVAPPRPDQRRPHEHWREFENLMGNHDTMDQVANAFPNSIITQIYHRVKVRTQWSERYLGDLTEVFRKLHWQDDTLLKPRATQKTLAADVDLLNKHYPMLLLLLDSSWYRLSFAQIQHYIKLVEECNK